MKKSFLVLFLVTATLLSLNACQPSTPQAQSTIKASMTDSGFRPGKWWVPAGETITLNLSNQGDAIHDWTLLARPLTDPFNENDRKNILFQSILKPRESTTITFRAPAMPGEYDVVSTQPGDVDAGLIARLITIQQ
jgi:uncharacterized cupredoxin-like copper-binding protein